MRTERLTKRQKRIAGIVILLLVLAFTGFICVYIGRPMLSFVSEPDRFRAWVGEHGMWGRLAFIGMVIFQIVVAVVPGEPLEIGAGYAFGAAEGTILCLIGSVIGSILVFFCVRTFGVKFVELFFPREKILSLRFLQNEKRTNLLIFILFLLPGTPKDLLCYFVPLTKIRLRIFILISAVARIPSIITSTVGGAALGDRNYIFAVVVFLLTLLVSLGGMLLYRLICRAREKRNESN